MGGYTIFCLIAVFVGTSVLGEVAVQVLRKIHIEPAKTIRDEIIKTLRKFSFDSVEASVPEDMVLVRGMIAEMWKPQTGEASEANCIKVFEEEVRGEVAKELNKLLMGTERDLVKQYRLMNLMTHLCGLVYFAFAMDWFRPIASPRAGLWIASPSSSSSNKFFFWIFLGCCFFPICLLIVIHLMGEVKGKRGPHPDVALHSYDL